MMGKLSSALAVVCVTSVLALPTLALDSISLPGGIEPAPESAEDGSVACPQLARIKYPFLSCHVDQDGNVLFDAFGAGWSAGWTAGSSSNR